MLALQWGGAIAVAAVGVWIVAYILVRWHLGRASVRWPHTTGRVLFAFVYPMRKIAQPYGLEVYYDYTVNGRRHQGHEAPYGKLGVYIDQEAADEARRTYPHHGPVTVYYDPRHPFISTLHPDWHGGPALIAAAVMLGLAFVGLSVLLLTIPLPQSAAHPFQPHAPEPVSRETAQQARYDTFKVISYLVWLATAGGLAIWAHRCKHRYHPAIPTAIVSVVFGALEAGGYVFGVFALSVGHMLLGAALWLVVTVGAAYVFRAYARRGQLIAERNARRASGKPGGTRSGTDADTTATPVPG